MKVLFISSDASILDVGSSTRARMQAYGDQIGELHLLIRSHRTHTTHDGSITIHEVRTSKLGALFVLPRRARALIRTRGIEIVSAQDPFEHGLIGLFSVGGTSAKLHIQIHTDFLSPWFTYGYSRQVFLNHIRLFIASLVLPKADGIRAVAPRVKRSVMVRYGNRIVEPSFIPVSVEDSEADTKEETAPFPCTLLSIGRLEPEKRFMDVINALVEVRKTNTDAGLVIAGEGREGVRLRRAACALGLEKHVRFLGMRADVSHLMRAAHVYVQASAYEGYSRTLVEAARAGLPIVTTDVGIVGDVLLPNTHVLVSHVGDVTTFASNVTRLIEDSALRTALSIAAHQAVKEHLRAFRNQPELIAHDLENTLTV